MVCVHAGSQEECEELRRVIEVKDTQPRDSPELRRLQRELSMRGEIRFWRTRYSELCNKYGEKGVSYRSGAMESMFLA